MMGSCRRAQAPAERAIAGYLRPQPRAGIELDTRQCRTLTLGRNSRHQTTDSGVQKGEISTCSGANLSFSFIQFCLARKEDQGFERKMIRGEGAQAFSREWSQMLDCRRCWTAEMQVFTCTS